MDSNVSHLTLVLILVAGRGGRQNNCLVVQKDSASHVPERATLSEITTTEPETALSEAPVAQLSPAHGEAEGHSAGEAVGVIESPDLPHSVKPDADEPIKPEDLPVKLSEPDIISPEEEVTVLKERDKAIPQDVEDKTNLVLPGHENKGGELVGVQEKGLSPNGAHQTMLDTGEDPKPLGSPREPNGHCPVEHIEEVPPEVEQQAEQRTVKPPSKPSFTEQEGSGSSSSYDVFPIRPVEESINEFTEVFNSSDENIQEVRSTKEPSSVETPDFMEEVPIPFTIVEKVPDKEPPTCGEDIGNNSSLREGVEDRQADAEPDQVIEPEKPQLNDEVLEETNEQISVPLLVVDKTDDKPSYGDDFGAESSHTQKLAHGKRAADAEPDEIRITLEGRALDGVAVEGNEHTPTSKPEESPSVEGLPEIVEVSETGKPAEIEKGPASSEAVEKVELTEPVEAPGVLNTLKPEPALGSQKATETAEAPELEEAVSAANITENIGTPEVVEAAEPEEEPGELGASEVAEVSEVEKPMVPVETIDPTGAPEVESATEPEVSAEVSAAGPEGVLAEVEALETTAVPEAMEILKMTAGPEVVEETMAREETAQSVETPGAEEIMTIAEAPVGEEASELERASDLEEVRATAGDLEVANVPVPEEAPKPEEVVGAMEHETLGIEEAAEVADVLEHLGVDGATITESLANHMPKESSVLAESATSPTFEAGTNQGTDETGGTITKGPDSEWDMKAHEESGQAILEHTRNDKELIKDASHPSRNKALPASDVGAAQENDYPDRMEADRTEDVAIRSDEDLEAPTDPSATVEIPEAAMEVPLENRGPTEAAFPVVPAEQGPVAEDTLKDKAFIAPSLRKVNESGSHVDSTGVREESLGTNQPEEKGAGTPKTIGVLMDTNGAKEGNLVASLEIPDDSPGMKISKEEDGITDHDIVDESREPKLAKEEACELPGSANRSPETEIPKEKLIRVPSASETPETGLVEEGNSSEVHEVIGESSKEFHQDPWATVDREAVHTKRGVEDELLSETKHEERHEEKREEEHGEEHEKECEEEHEEKQEEKHEEKREGNREEHEDKHGEKHGGEREENYRENQEEEHKEGREEPTPMTGTRSVEPAVASAPRDSIVSALDPHTATTDVTGNANKLGGPELDLGLSETKPLSLTPDVASAATEATNLVNTNGMDEYASQPGLGFSKFAAAVGHNLETDSPRIEDAPLFAHECLTPCEERPVGPKHQLRSSLVGSDSPPEPEEPSAVDLEDPLLEAFPSDREHIIERLRTTESRLEEDETLVEGIPPSPVFNKGNQPSETAARRSPSPLVERSPNLDAIPEEDAPSSNPQVHSLPEAASVGLESHDDRIISIPATGTSAVLAGVTAAAIASRHGESSEGTPQDDRVYSLPSTLLPRADSDTARQSPAALDTEAEKPVDANPKISEAEQDTHLLEASISPERNNLPTDVPAELLLSSLEQPEAAKPTMEAEPEPAERIDIPCDPKSQLAEASAMPDPDAMKDRAAAEGVTKSQVLLESPAYEDTIQADVAVEGSALSTITSTGHMQAQNSAYPKVPQVIQGGIHATDEVSAEAEAKTARGNISTEGELKQEDSPEQDVSVNSTRDTGDALSAGIDTRDTATKVIAGEVIGTAIIVGGAVSVLKANERDEAPDNPHNTALSTTRNGPGAGPQFITPGPAITAPTQEQGEDVTEGAVTSEVIRESEHNAAKAPAPAITITSEPDGAENDAQAELTGVGSVGDSVPEGGLRQRKATTDAGDRPRTPHSIQSTRAQRHSNIFKTFWRTVFGGWIGGFFSKIFSKKQRRA
jgi:hypothetical protein